MELSKIMLLSSILLLGACHGSTTVKPDPYLIPDSRAMLEECAGIIKLESAESFQEVLKNKIDNDTNFKICISKNKALIEVLESLEDEQIIRFITPESKGRGNAPKVSG